MENIKQFIKENRTVIDNLTKTNPVITKEDEWYKDDVWNKHNNTTIFVKLYIQKFIVLLRKEYPTILINYSYDKEEDFYSIQHNSKELQFNNEEFLNKVGQLINEVLYENDIYNFSFGYDFN